MTRPHLIVRLLFGAMGIYLLMRFLNSIYSAANRFMLKCPQDTFIASITIITATGVVTLAISFILLFKSDGLAKLIAGPDACQCQKIDCAWITAGFRMTACLCGLLILYPRVELLIVNFPAIINGPKTFFDMVMLGSPKLSIQTLTRAILETAKGIFGLYLVLGAPHYVRWQLRAPKLKKQNEIGGVVNYE
jgi:uncharacterized BrkB/YihY/UPF0761 family membrane protein